MDSIPAQSVDGKTGLSATHLEYNERNRIRRNEIAKLRNYLFKQFELYITMNLDHRIDFSNCHVCYDAKQKHFVSNQGQVFYRVSKLAWHLRQHYGIRSPNGKNEWVILESNSNSGLKS